MKRAVVAGLAVVAALFASTTAIANPGQAPFREGRRGLDRGRGSAAPEMFFSFIGDSFLGRDVYYREGQSNEIGEAPVLSWGQPFSNVRAASGTLPVLVETGNETLVSADCNEFSFLSGGNQSDWACFQRSGSGLLLTDLSKGSTIYNQILTQYGQTRGALGVTPSRVCSYSMLHGSSDSIADPPNGQAYRSGIAQLRVDFENDLKAIYNQDCPLLLFLHQTVACTGVGTCTDVNIIAAAQLGAAQDHPNRIFNTGAPEYAARFVSGDRYHLDNIGSRMMGAYYGKVRWAVLVLGTPWRPLMIDGAYGISNGVRLILHVPCMDYRDGTPERVRAERCSSMSPPLVFDSNPDLSDGIGVSKRPGNGFRYIDNGIGIPPTMVGDPTVCAACPECAADQWCVDVALTGNARTGAQVGYADDNDLVATAACQFAHDDGGVSGGPGCGAAGNLHDLDETIAAYATDGGVLTDGGPLYNWSVVQRVDLDGGTVAPANPATVTNAQGLDLSDNTEYLEVADNAAFDSYTAMTVFSIVRIDPAAIASSQHVAGKWVSNQGWLLRTDTLDNTDLIAIFNTTSNFVRATGANLATGVTYCVALTYQGALGTAQIWTGTPGAGVSMPTQSISGTIPASIPDVTASLTFGFLSGNLFGLRDEPAIWNVALSQSAISAICNGYSGTTKVDLMNTPNLTVPRGWWPGEDGAGGNDTGTTVTDRTGNGRNGTLQSGGALTTAPGLP